MANYGNYGNEPRRKKIKLLLEGSLTLDEITLNTALKKIQD
jgi:hypothetical protein